MNFYQATKLRQEQLSKIPLKGKSQEKLKELLIKHSHGLAESLYHKYKSRPRLHLLLPEIGDYQSLVYEACLKTVDVYDYHRWKKHGDLKAKARIKKWRNKRGKEYSPRTKQNFKHLGHLYGYMFLTVDNYVRMNIESLFLEKRRGMEVYPSQLKTDDPQSKSSFFELVMGPVDNQESETIIFHKEIMRLLPKEQLISVSAKSCTYAELYYLRYVEELTEREVGKKIGTSAGTVHLYVEQLNKKLIPILNEREAA